MRRKIYVFDTTLRDGEQVPGAKLNLEEKVQIAAQLAKLKVDMMEVGFPSSSKGDFEAVREIARRIQGDIMVTALGRAVRSDIDIMQESLREASNPLIHIVLGSSNIHLDKKFHKTPEQIMEMGVEAVKYARKFVSQVEYSLEDASRSDFEYMWKTVEAVVRAGATMVNIPDTVGFAVPEEFGAMFARFHERLRNLSPDVLLSVHCHNDTGLATANTLAAVKNGANKVECTINGIGERAGNTSLEEVVMGLRLHPDYYDAYTDIQTKEIYETSRVVSATMGLDVQVNKAITGENAFAHSSGIHQDGLLKSKEVYEIIEPETVGAPPMEIVLTARSGKHAFTYRADKLGYHMEEKDTDVIYRKFLEMADSKKEVYDSDIITLFQSIPEIKAKSHRELWQLEDFQVRVNTALSTAAVKLKRGDTSVAACESIGKGAVDSLYSAIISAVKMDITLIEYRIHNISRGKEGLGKVTVQIQYQNTIYQGKAIERDVMKASAAALINAVNKAFMK